MSRSIFALLVLALLAGPVGAGEGPRDPFEPETIHITPGELEELVDGAFDDWDEEPAAPPPPYLLASPEPVVEPAIHLRGDATIFPFGKSQPEVSCSPLRACDIELQAGEVVTGVALGDTERWITSPLLSGDPEEPIPHVIVKPEAYDLATNLVIATTRRTYHLGLVSPPEEDLEAGDAPYHRHVAFSYPQEMVELWASEKDLRRVTRRAPASAPPQEPGILEVDSLHFGYGIKADRKIRWAPSEVFDDGRHVYIQLPASVRAGDLPALLVDIEGGGLAAINYRVQGTWYIVDGLFQKAALVLGVGKKRRQVEIFDLRHYRKGA